MLAASALRKILPTLPRGPLRGPWYRAVRFDLLSGPARPGSPAPQPLWAAGAARWGARFTPRSASTLTGGPVAGIDMLYLSEDESTPLAEIAGVLRPPGSKVKLLFEPQVVMTVDGALTDILDLTDPAVQNALGASHQQLTGAWVVQQSLFLAGAAPMPATQVLGREALRTGRIVGLRYPSSKVPAGVGVVVFIARLRAGAHRLELYNQPSGLLQGTLP